MGAEHRGAAPGLGDERHAPPLRRTQVVAERASAAKFNFAIIQKMHCRHPRRGVGRMPAESILTTLQTSIATGQLVTSHATSTTASRSLSQTPIRMTGRPAPGGLGDGTAGRASPAWPAGVDPEADRVRFLSAAADDASCRARGCCVPIAAGNVASPVGGGRHGPVKVAPRPTDDRRPRLAAMRSV